ncbi:MAG: carbon storage regulator CsrA [Deltaproteobacteria bacterium]|nr:carbon storage regulator CsrA [Deltaproteobacteria bacterium]
MLAVTRKLNDKIHINDDIVIHILDIKSKNVRIGIEAPSNYLIFRGELYEKILESNKEMIAADFTSEDIKAFLGSKGRLKKKEEKP